MCQIAKHSQSHKAAQPTQSSSSSSNSCRQHSSSSSSSNNNNSYSSRHCCRIYRYALLMALAALLLLPLPQTDARHLHDLSYDEDVSSDSDSDSAGLPAWHANPFHGLEQSFPDSGSSSSSSSSYDSSSSSSSSSAGDLESEGSYEEIAQAALHAAMRELRRQRIRHRRSHLLRFFTRSKLEAEAAPAEWENPCGGTYLPDEGQSLAESDSSAQGRMIKREFLIMLRNNTMREYEYMRTTAALDYGAFEHWQHEYKFLPNMTRPSSVVKLKTWYRHIQTYVGSFAYLGKAHYKYRKEHQMSLDATTHELHELLVSARRMLCEIETTINSSYPNSHGAKLSQVSRAAMAERLKFYTPADGSKEADLRDLKFSKELYYHYLDNMWKSLRRSLRRHHHRSSSLERRQHAAAAAAAAGTAVASVSGSSSGSGSLQAFSLESSESGGSTGAGAGKPMRRA